MKATPPIMSMPTRKDKKMANAMGRAKPIIKEKAKGVTLKTKMKERKLSKLNLLN